MVIPLGQVLPFRRLAERDPDKASMVFAKLLCRAGFDWRRDGEALMRLGQG